jgi:ribosomal-protein-alanine N-acetyltransferase
MAAPEIETERLYLTIPPPEAAARMATFAVENEPHLGKWEPPRPEGYFSEDYWYRRLERNHDEQAHDLSLRLAIFRRNDLDGPVCGHVNFNQIQRGGFQACTLGYSLDHRCEGRGMMTEALGAAVPYVFGELKLHRIQANYIPTNERSAHVLRRLGFVVEGYARDYLFIGGGWRDHILTALTNPRAPVPLAQGGTSAPASPAPGPR